LIFILFNFHLYLFSLKVQFIPSKYKISLEDFGCIKRNSCWFNDSLILNDEECLSLVEMTNSTKGNLLYRATRDGFEAQAFHTRCDGKPNTITIIKNNLNYVFGGFASSAWNSSGRYIHDENAFLFSLRRNGVSSKDKFMTKNPVYSLYGKSDYGPTFGGGHDIHICHQSNVCHGQYSFFGEIWPSGDANFYLGGNHLQWLTSEIEVYQMI
jgi:hypothetical protein